MESLQPKLTEVLSTLNAICPGNVMLQEDVFHGSENFLSSGRRTHAHVQKLCTDNAVSSVKDSDCQRVHVFNTGVTGTIHSYCKWPLTHAFDETLLKNGAMVLLIMHVVFMHLEE